MHDDENLGARPDGDVGQVAAGDGDTDVTTIFQTPDNSRFEATDLFVSYGLTASAATTIEIHDAPDGTAAGNLDADTLRATITLSGSVGESVQLSGFTFRPFEQDVLVDPDGNQDGNIDITVGGEIQD